MDPGSDGVRARSRRRSRRTRGGEDSRGKKVAPANLGDGFQLDLPGVIKFNVTLDLSAYLYDPEKEAEAAQAAVNAAKKSQAAAADRSFLLRNRARSLARRPPADVHQLLEIRRCAAVCLVFGDKGLEFPLN